SKNNSKPKTYKPSTGGQNRSKYPGIHARDAIAEIKPRDSCLDLLNSQALYWFPEDEASRKALCHTLLAWSRKEDVWTLQEFSDEYGLDRDYLYDYAKRYKDDIGIAFKRAKRNLAAKRVKGVMNKDISENAAYKDIHRYDEE